MVLGSAFFQNETASEGLFESGDTGNVYLPDRTRYQIKTLTDDEFIVALRRLAGI